MRAKGHKDCVVVTRDSAKQGGGKGPRKQLVTVCSKKGIVLCRPNTMGILSPVNLYATGPHTRPRQGGVAFISRLEPRGQLTQWAGQAGGRGVRSLWAQATRHGDLLDYLEYVAEHTQTGHCSLPRSMREGRRFFETARKINRTNLALCSKKRGRTERGGGFASHTVSMSGEITVFRAACRQRASWSEVPSELLIFLQVLMLAVAQRDRVWHRDAGGDGGVVTSDECNEKGLLFPRCPRQSLRH